jgi:hypothetical protein
MKDSDLDGREILGAVSVEVIGSIPFPYSFI